MKVKKIFAALLAAAMLFGMAPVALADDVETIVALEAPAVTEYAVEKGRSEDELGLPKTLRAEIKAGEAGESSWEDIDVSWACSGYDNSLAGEYTFEAVNNNSYPVAAGVEWPRVLVHVCHTVTLPTGTGFTAAFEGGGLSRLVKDGGSVNFTVTEAEGYTVSDDQVMASSGAILRVGGGGSFSLEDVGDDINVSVIATPKTYELITSVIPESDTHAHIDEGFTYSYSAEGTIRVHLHADEGYVISAVIVDGIALTGAELSNAISLGYVTLDRKGDHSVSVSSSPGLRLTTSNDDNCSIDPGFTYSYSEVETFQVHFEAKAGYVISGVTVDGTALTGTKLSNAISQGYVTLDKKSNHSVSVSSQLGTYTVTFRNGTTTLYTDSVTPGGYASYVGSTPVKASSGGYSYTFAGWSTTDTTTVKPATNIVTLNSYPINSNLTLYAVYKVSATGINLGVTLDDNSGYKFSESTQLDNSIVSQLGSRAASVLGTTPTAVKFGAQNTAYTKYGILYTNSGYTGLSTSASYYYSSPSDGSYALSGVYFAPTGTAGTYYISYTAYDAYGNSMAGTISISSPGSGNITYSTQAKAAVRFNASDFYEFYDDNSSSGSLRYVRFDSGSSLGSSYGYIYYNYGGSNSTYFTSSTIDNYEFYYNNASYGDYPLSDLYFVPGAKTGDYSFTIGFTAYYSESKYVSGTLKLEVKGGGSQGEITYTTQADTAVRFDASDFYEFFDDHSSTGSLRYVRFDSGSSLGSSYGYIYYKYGTNSSTYFTSSTIDNYEFYYNNSAYGDYALGDLYFVPGTKTGDYSFAIGFTAYYTESKCVAGTLKLEVKGGGSQGEITYATQPGAAVRFDASDFYEFFDDHSSTGSLRYVRFDSGSSLGSSYGYIYYKYGTNSSTYFTSSTIDNYEFYYNNSAYGDYALGDLYFVPGTKTGDYSFSIGFTAYYTDAKYVSGTLTLKVGAAGIAGGDITYNTTKGNAISFNAHDIAEFFRKTYPSYTLKYVVLNGVPDIGTLYYNYNKNSPYGSSSSIKLTKSNCDDYIFYYSPADSDDYALNALTYLPSGSNYCVSVPFTAYYSSSRYVKGSILINVTNANLKDIYYATKKNTSVRFTANDFYTAVHSATSGALSYIRFDSLPAANEGTLYYNYTSPSNYGHKVSSSNSYYYGSSGTYKLSNITFVPYTGFTGSVPVSYIAYDGSGKALAAGELSFGVMNSIEAYSDVAGSDWFYKYVVELSDDEVIDGYPDGSFKPAGNVSYGEALKLIMLAAGYSEQAKTASHWASGYLSKAISEGLLRSAVDLDAAITRLEIAKIAAMALDLDTATPDTPFADTSDRYVLALYENGIVEGSFNSKGVRYYYPSAYITRAEISAIIWRINKMTKN